MDKIKFLVVDDIPENILALEVLLRRPELEILTASSGTQALELLLQHEIALALIDVQMPEMDGFELAELMRGAERTKHMPIIFVTAASREQQRVFRGYETGAVDFLFKPIDPMALHHKAETFFQLACQRQQLERAVRTRDDLLAVVSHDLRDPLNVINITSTLMMRNPAVAHDEGLMQNCQMLQRSVERMQRLITDLMDMAALRAGRMAVQRKPEPFGNIVREVLESQRAIARARGITLELDVDDAIGTVNCDRERLLQVFGNLIGNALKFCRNEGCKVQVAAHLDGDAVHCSVSDNGPGIALEDQSRLFDAYWSGKRHLRHGTGLGLYISHGIVTAHGGRIWVESEPGQGSRFRFTLPRN